MKSIDIKGVVTVTSRKYVLIGERRKQTEIISKSIGHLIMY